MFGNVQFGQGFNQESTILQDLVISNDIRKGLPARFILGQSNIPSGATIHLSIVGEDGKALTDSNNVSTENIVLSEYDNSGIYYTDITLNTHLQDQYIRLFYTSNEINVLPTYQPQDAKLIGSYSKTAEIVPLQYFIDYVLNANNNLDPLYKKAINDYVTNNRDGIRRYLYSAESKLETKTKLYFSERIITGEKRDYFFDRFSMHLWQFAVSNPPVNELIEFQIKYGNNAVANISPNLFVFDRIEGLIEFLPAPTGDSAGIYSMLMNNNLMMSGTSLTFLTASNLERIPALFRVTYKTGLIYQGCDEKEKESIRMAICNRALIELLPKIDPAMRTGNYSEGIDGVSGSRNYIVKEVLKDYKEQEDEFCENLRMKYNRNVDIAYL